MCLQVVQFLIWGNCSCMFSFRSCVLHILLALSGSSMVDDACSVTLTLHVWVQDASGSPPVVKQTLNLTCELVRVDDTCRKGQLESNTNLLISSTKQSAGLDVPVIYVFPQNVELCADSFWWTAHSEGLRIMEASVAEGAVCVCCGLLSVVSQLADRPRSLGSCAPALSHTSAWQAKLLKGRARTGWLRSAQLTHEMKTQCYRSATASLMSQCFINKRQVTLSAWIICLDSLLM